MSKISEFLNGETYIFIPYDLPNKHNIKKVKLMFEKKGIYYDVISDYHVGIHILINEDFKLIKHTNKTIYEIYLFKKLLRLSQNTQAKWNKRKLERMLLIKNDIKEKKVKI